MRKPIAAPEEPAGMGAPQMLPSMGTSHAHLVPEEPAGKWAKGKRKSNFSPAMSLLLPVLAKMNTGPKAREK